MWTAKCRIRTGSQAVQLDELLQLHRDVSLVHEPVLLDRLRRQALERQLPLRLEYDLGDGGGRALEGRVAVDVDDVDVRAGLDQKADDGVEAGEIVHDPLVGDDAVQRRVALVVHRLDVGARLHQQLRRHGAREAHDVGNVEAVDGCGGLDAQVQEGASVSVPRVQTDHLKKYHCAQG